MSTYREIVGKKIKKVTSDPSTGIDGQMWYNSTTGTIRALGVVEAWVSSSNAIQARDEIASQAGSGTQNAAFAAGGFINPPPGATALTENYNGTGWSAGANIPTATWAMGGAGTTTASLVFGGLAPSTSPQYRVETYEGDGSSYSDGGDLNTGRYQVTGVGTQTAGLAFAGGYPSNFGSTLTEEYNGSSWTAVNTMGTATYAQAGTGTSQTSAVSFGGGTFPPTVQINVTQEYDGTNWSTGENLPSHLTAASAAGSQTASLLFGGLKSSGSPPSLAQTTENFKYDGTNFSAAPALSTAVNSQGSSGSQSAAISFLGLASARTAATEEFTSSTNTITAAAWASGGAMSSGRYGGVNAGTKDAALYSTGYNNSTSTYTNATEEYNGTSWSGGGNINVLGQSSGSSGTQTACWAAGRGPNNPPGQGPIIATEEYDGSSWTSSGNMNTSTAGPGGCGTQTAASFARGSQDHEYYNGSAWTAQTDSPSPSRGGGVQAGTQTANIYFGAEIPGGTYVNTTFEWDGSSWTSGGTMVFPQAGAGGGIGTQTAAMQAQGYSPSTSPNRMAETSGYDGTSWSTRPSLSTGRSNGGNSTASPNSDAVTFTGTTGSPVTNTEEFTGETSTANIGTFSTS